MTNHRLVYSTDDPAGTKRNKSCSRCKELLADCRCEKTPAASPDNFTAIMRMEKKGRGGKVVTVIAGLPRATPFLKNLTSDLKRRCGTGGTFVVTPKEGQIELQGDRREALREILTTLGIRHKG